MNAALLATQLIALMGPVPGPDGTAVKMDAGQTATLARQLEYMESRVFTTKYPALKARSFIPVDTGIPAGAETITYRVWDGYAMAKVVANYADDIEMVDVTAKEITSRIKSVASGYTFSVQDLRAIAMSGQPIDTMRAAMARRAIEAGLDEVAAFGIPEAGMPGFVNHPNVPLVSPITGTWSGATDAQIMADFGKLVKSIVIATKGIHTPDTVIFDTDTFELLANKVVGQNLDRTLLDVLLKNSPHIRNIDFWPKLATANAAGTGPRIVCYARDSEVLELKIAQEFEQFPPQPVNLAFKVPCHARIGGTVIRYPLAVAYMDGC